MLGSCSRGFCGSLEDAPQTQGREVPALLLVLPRQPGWSSAIVSLDHQLDLMGALPKPAEMVLDPRFNPLELLP
jgi:hypothetical protein